MTLPQLASPVRSPILKTLLVALAIAGSLLVAVAPDRAESAVGDKFLDVPRTHTFVTEIEWLASQGITGGYDVAGGKEFRPSQSILREQMAAFLYRFAGQPDYTAPQVSPFLDVPKTHSFYKEMAWLAAQGISGGYDVAGGKEFRPSQPVLREQMAAFLYRFAGQPDYTAPQVSPFLDVPKTHSFYKEMAWLAAQGISGGYDVAGGKEFRPSQPVLREQMAAFLYRYAGSPSPSNLVTGADTTKLVEAAVNRRFPAGASSAIVVPQNNAQLIAEAAAHASAMDLPLVLTSTSSATTLVTRLNTLGATAVTLYGSGNSFGTSFVSSLNAAGVSTANPIALNTAPERTAAAAARVVNPTLAIVVSAQASDQVRGLAAAAAASASRRPLIVMTGPNSSTTDPDAAVRAYFGGKPVSRVLVVGSTADVDLTAIEGSDQTVPETAHIVAASSGDAAAVSTELVKVEAMTGRSVRNVFVAKSDLASLSTAGYIAFNQGVALLGPSATAFSTATVSSTAAGSWVKQLGGEVASVTLVGTGMTARDAINVESAAASRPAPPAFRATSFNVGATATQVALSTVGGAAAYVAYDVWGAEVARSATAAVSVPVDSGGLLIVAENSGGGEIASVHVRTNGRTADEDPSTVTLVSTNGSVHELLWAAQPTAAAKQVTRYAMDPDAAGDLPLGDGVAVGITCSNKITDATADLSKQYTYTIEAMSTSAASTCATAGQADTTGLELKAASVVVPSFDASAALIEGPPDLLRSPSAIAENQPPRRALLSIADRQMVPDELETGELDAPTLQQMQGEGAAGDPQAAAVWGDGWLPFTVRYQGFIPGDRYNMSIRHPNPFFFHYLLQVNGNGRTKGDPKGDFKFRGDSTFYFGSTHRLSSQGTIPTGTSRLWGCAAFGAACVQLASGQPYQHGFTFQTPRSSNVGGSVSMVVDTKIPILEPIAPAINGRAQVDINPGGSSVVVVHDRMPVHEVWGGPVPGEYFQIYQSTSYADYCLFGTGPGCLVISNNAV